jgi:hypothetical protein
MSGISVYAGEILVSPAALECSLNWCSHDCSFCFANLASPDRKADLTQIFNLLADFQNRKSREAVLLQGGYPMLLSNRVDPFAGSNAKLTEPIWELCTELGIPLTWQTRGAHKPQQKILDRIIAESPPQVWYISLSYPDDRIRQIVEPHAPSIDYRFALIEQLVDAGHVVNVALNPLTAEWMPEPEPVLDRLRDLGVWGTWIEALYMGSELEEKLSPAARTALTPELLTKVGAKGDPLDKALAQQAREYAAEIGLEPFSLEHEGPTGYFDPWHELYPNLMPYWQQVINAADYTLEEGDDESYVVITKADALEVLEEIPDIDWTWLLLQRRAKRYREICPPLTADGPLPKADREKMLDIFWNDDKFGARMGLTHFHRFANAALIDENKVITPIVDENGDKIVLYRRSGYKHTYTHAPELAE